MKVINFVGGPCSGKSTLGTGLFYQMKKDGYNVEFVHEWAKELTWDERKKCLQDQLSILGHQNNMVNRLSGKVDWVVTDSSIILGLMYAPENYYKTFPQMVLEVFNSYDNITIYVNRPDVYQSSGRNQNQEQAKLIDLKIKNMLKSNNIDFMEVNYNIDVQDLLNLIKKQGDKL